MRRTDTLIAGGGPAGSAVAIMLARAGVRPLVIERHREPHDVVCGGFLGWDALDALDTLGIDAMALGARPIHRLRIHAGSHVAETDLPYRAAGLSRRTLDGAMIAHAGRLGAAIERGVAMREARARTVRMADGTTIEGQALFLATGKHELRGFGRVHRKPGADPAVGLRTRLPPCRHRSRALDGVIELHLIRDGYVGLLLQEDGATNLCLSVAQSRLAGMSGGAFIAHLSQEAPRLAERYGAPGITAWQAIAAIPYGWRARTTDEGLFRVGDQAAVIASLAGDGVAIALASGRSAALHWLRDGPAGAQAHQRRFARLARRPLAVATMLRRLAEGPLSPAIIAMLAKSPAAIQLLARLSRIKS